MKLPRHQRIDELKFEKLKWLEIIPGENYLAPDEDMEVSKNNDGLWGAHPAGWPNLSNEWPFETLEDAQDYVQTLFEKRISKLIVKDDEEYNKLQKRNKELRDLVLRAAMNGDGLPDTWHEDARKALDMK
jgi:hypothetical protein